MTQSQYARQLAAEAASVRSAAAVETARVSALTSVRNRVAANAAAAAQLGYVPTGQLQGGDLA